MNIRKAQISDLSQLSELFDLYRIFYRKESDLSAAENFIRARLEKEDAVIYVAESSDQLVGFTQLYPSFSSTRMQRMWILNDLYVHKTFRGQGISKLLINKAKDLCRETNACGMLLETETSNDIGNKLYPATGFHLEENNFYFWGVD